MRTCHKEEIGMEESIANERNGATWIRDCLLDSAEIARAVDRLQLTCRDGIRHFSAVGMTVPLNEARKMEGEIFRYENEALD
jgi:hypothetical protein